jgi:hypothetical protein
MPKRLRQNTTRVRPSDWNNLSAYVETVDCPLSDIVLAW